MFGGKVINNKRLHTIEGHGGRGYFTMSPVFPHTAFTLDILDYFQHPEITP